MTTFTFVVRTKSGQNQSGTIQANSRDAAFAALRAKGLQPIVVKPKGGSGLSMNIKLPGSSGVKTQDLVIFTRQFSTMVSAGVPMLRSLTTLHDQAESAGLKEVLGRVIADVQGGVQLSEAMAKHPKVFSAIYTNMVQAGEAGGILDKILDRLASQLEKDADIKGKLKGAMIYPAVISLVAVGAVSFLMVSIVPKLTSILKDAGVPLPLQTKVVMAISNFMATKWYIIIAVIVVLAIAFRQWVKKPKGRYQFHKLQLRMPIFGVIVMKVNVARFARIFSSLMAAGVNVTDSLTVTAGALSNAVVQKTLLDAVQSVKNGGTIASGLSGGNVLPPIVVQMAAVGEETGEMDTVLEKVAEFYEKEVDNTVAAISSIIEPVLIVGLGSIVALIVASILGPVSSIQGAVGS